MVGEKVNTAGRNPESKIVISVLLLGSIILVFEGSLVSPALPAIEAAFSDTPNAPILTRLLFVITPLMIALSSPVMGIIADKFGRKSLFIGSTVLVAISGGAGYVAGSLGTLIALRAILGVGIAGVGVSATAIITDYYSGHRRERILGLQGAAAGYGGVVLVLIAGMLTDISWNVPFLVFLVVLLLIPFQLRYLWDPEPTESASAAPHSVDELRRSLDRLPTRALAVIYSVVFFSTMVFFLVMVQGPYYLSVLLDASGAQIGGALAVYTLFMGIAGSAYGRVKKRADVVTIVGLMFFIMSIGYTITGIATTYNVFLIGMAFGGLGFGLLLPNLNTWISMITSQETRGRALGGLMGLFFFGQFVSPFITQPLGEQFGIPATFVGTGVLLFALAVFFVALRRGGLVSVPEPTSGVKQ